MYVGHDIVQEIYKKHLKGVSDADVGSPTDNSSWVSAHYYSYGSSALCIGSAGYAGVSDSFKIFRCTGTPNLSDDEIKSVS